MKEDYFINLQVAMQNYVSILLLKLGAVKINKDEPFKYASGNVGPIYVDCRVLISHPIQKKIIAGFFANLLSDIDYEIDLIAGGETAGMSFAEELADLVNKPYYYIRKEQKEHGLQGRVVGDSNIYAHKIMMGLLVEDLITDGKSKISFIDALRDASIQCEYCFVVIDRQQGGKESLSNINVKLYSLTTLIGTLSVGRETEVIDEETYQDVLHYLEDPEKWSVDRGYDFIK